MILITSCSQGVENSHNGDSKPSSKIATNDLSHEGPSSPVFHETETPSNLSEWGVLIVHDEELALGEDVQPYTLNSPLFTDYALKLRTLWIGEGQAKRSGGNVLEFPVGTIISKTFYYPKNNNGHVFKQKDVQPVHHNNRLKLSNYRLLETRLLVKREAGWEPISYIWDHNQKEARLKRTGALIKLTMENPSFPVSDNLQNFTYVVPNINQCAGCHAANATTKKIMPLGPKPGQLNGDYHYADGTFNQLERLEKRGWLDHIPSIDGHISVLEKYSFAGLEDESAALEVKARSYLDSNCAHCHNPVGPADTSGLHLNIENESVSHLGVCKPPIAAGGGTGGRQYDIDPGDGQGSILHYRMTITDPGAMMPELGRSLVHREGASLIERWIDNMDSACES